MNSPIALSVALLASTAIYVGFLALGRMNIVSGSIWLALHVLYIAALQITALIGRRLPDEEIDLSWCRYAYLFFAGLNALTWGFSPLFLLQSINWDETLVLALASAVVASAAVVVFGYYLQLTFTHFLLLSIPWVFMFLMLNDYRGYVLAAMTLFYIVGLSILAVLSHKVFLKAVLTSIENEGLARELAQQRDAAQRANAGKTHFLAAASHDLRQPVQSLMMLVGALEARALDRDLRMLADQIARSVEAIGGLLNSLLDISRIDAGVVKVNLQSFDMGGFLERIAQDYVDEAAAKGLAIRVVPSSARIRTDPVLLESILRNLISNAVRYTERGGVLIGCRRRSAHLAIAVLDTGVGIAEAFQDRVFEEFFQVGNVERNRAKGLGLGLAIVRRLGDLIGARIVLRSEPGRGTTVVVNAPRETTFPARRARARSRDRDVSKSIMVIDDDVAICDAMRMMLDGWGHQTSTATSGAEAFAVMSRLPSAPDLIICDYRLGEDENGVRLLNQIREQEQLTIPGIILTGDTAPNRLREAHESGYKVLHKPLTAHRLKEAITAES